MDRSFPARIVHYLLEGTLPCIISHFILLVQAQSVAPAFLWFCPGLSEFKFSPMMFGLMILAWFLIKLFMDPEMRSTWTRIFCCIFVLFTGTALVFLYLPKEFPHERFSNAFKDVGYWLWPVCVISASIALFFHPRRNMLV